MIHPEPSEYNPYYDKYISLITEDDLLGVLKAQPAELHTLLGTLPAAMGDHSYAEGKWTIKESISHIIDGERMFAYRVLRISRGDGTPIEGFEQDGYIENSHAASRSIADLLDEFDLVRQANLKLMQNLDADDWARLGTASGSPVSVRALGYVMAGHVRHHINIFTNQYLA